MCYMENEKIDFSYCNKYKIPKCAICIFKKSIFHIVTSIKYRNVLYGHSKNRVFHIVTSIKYRNVPYVFFHL